MDELMIVHAAIVHGAVVGRYVADPVELVAWAASRGFS
jgi:hypothetical protein